jgi:hypothetical protein
LVDIPDGDVEDTHVNGEVLVWASIQGGEGDAWGRKYFSYLSTLNDPELLKVACISPEV